MTELNIKNFQKAAGLKIDGDFGAKSEARGLELVTNENRLKAILADHPHLDPADAEATTVRTGSGELKAVTQFRLSAACEAKLKGVHPDLVRVVRRLERITTMPFAVTDGVRTKAQQELMVAKGASKTLNSRHLTGHAVDMVPLTDDGKPAWIWTLIWNFVPIVEQAAKEMGVDLEAGARWTSFPDGAHYQLTRKTYP